MAASADTVSAVIREHRTVYGINTGFGSLAHTRIADDQVTELQRRLVLSHAAGVGPLLDDRLGPADDDPEGEQPGAGLFRHQAAGAGSAW